MEGMNLELITALATSVDLLGVWITLLGAGRRRAPASPPAGVSLATILRAILVGGGLFTLKTPLLVFAGATAFGLMRAAYWDLVVIPPLAGLALLAAGRSRKGKRSGRPITPAARAVALAGLAVVPLAVYATYVAPFRLRVETTSIPVPPARAGHQPVRIAVLADLQTDRITGYERDAVERLNSLRPDVILLAGDLFQGDNAAFERELPALRELLGRLSAPGGIYCVRGNIDPENAVTRAIQGTGIQLLTNETARIVFGDRRLTITGLGWPHSTETARRTIDRLESERGDTDIRILLAHSPDAVFALSPETRVDLLVSGHTHGGQVQLPGLGPLMTGCCRTPRRVAAGGYHLLGGRPVYVSRGVGHERGQAPRIRLLCPPELSLLILGSPGP